MYAVFEDGSRQYRVSEGQLVRVDYRESTPGDRVDFNRVLLYRGENGLQIGQPTIEGLRIVGVVTEQDSTKTMIQHFRRRKNYRRLKGHTQPYTYVRIQHILLPGQEPPATAAQTQPEPNPAS